MTEGTGFFWVEGTVNPIPLLLSKNGTKFLLQFQKLLELLELQLQELELFQPLLQGFSTGKLAYLYLM